MFSTHSSQRSRVCVFSHNVQVITVSALSNFTFTFVPMEMEIAVEPSISGVRRFSTNLTVPNADPSCSPKSHRLESGHRRGLTRAHLAVYAAQIVRPNRHSRKGVPKFIVARLYLTSPTVLAVFSAQISH